MTTTKTVYNNPDCELAKDLGDDSKDEKEVAEVSKPCEDKPTINSTASVVKATTPVTEVTPIATALNVTAPVTVPEPTVTPITVPEPSVTPDIVSEPTVTPA